ncbi:hypothetical protein HanRHA438_Chr14g0633961 [Helianthus annuus]|nr:hypothetical protein HanRHA438_Chr14g0633961 [Helianthus annuus]
MPETPQSDLNKGEPEKLMVVRVVAGGAAAVSHRTRWFFLSNLCVPISLSEFPFSLSNFCGSLSVGHRLCIFIDRWLRNLGVCFEIIGHDSGIFGDC